MEDLSSIISIFNQAKILLKIDNIPQWQNGHPNKIVFKKDIKNNLCYLLIVNKSIVGISTMLFTGEPTYRYIYGGNWTNKRASYVTFHRIAISTKYRGQHLNSYLFSNLISLAYERGYRQFRIDTHKRNKRMQHIIKKFGFKYKGFIYLDPNEKYERNAYELNL